MQMRRKEKEITDKKELEKILKAAKVCRIAMVDGDKPYVVPLNYGYRDGVVYFHSAGQGRKVELIKKNPKVCFEIDEMIALHKAKQACDWGVDFRSIIAEGRATFLETKQEKINGLDIIMAQYSGRKFEYPDEMIEKTAVCAVRLERISGKKS